MTIAEILMRSCRRFCATKLSYGLAAVAVIVCCTLFSAGQVQHAQPLKLVDTIVLPSVRDGDFDHFAVDLSGHRLFLAAEANGVVEIFDAQRNKLIGSIQGLKAPHAVVFREDVKKLYVVDGDEPAVKIFDAETYKTLGQVPLAVDADSMAYDPDTHFMYVVNGGREAHTPYSLISVIDTKAEKKISDIKVDETNWLEGMALETSGPRLFVSMTGISAIGVIDRQEGKLVEKWPLPLEAQRNVALKFDEAGHRLFTVTRKPAALVVLDSDNGKMIASLPCAAMVDDISYDPSSKRIYLAGDKSIDVFQQNDSDHYSRLGSVSGAFRAKTAVLVSQWNRYYLAVPGHAKSKAEVRVFEVRQ
jgi:DNA-binding beta-propeller fold protein YncE